MIAAEPETFKRKTMMFWHTLTYNCQQQSAGGSVMTGSYGSEALNDESHHAVVQDQQITVRCPLGRPFWRQSSPIIQGLQTIIKWKQLQVKDNSQRAATLRCWHLLKTGLWKRLAWVWFTQIHKKGCLFMSNKCMIETLMEKHLVAFQSFLLCQPRLGEVYLNRKSTFP